MQAGQSSHVYTIAAPRDFFAAWLAPRLARFRDGNTDVRFVIVDGEQTDFTEANLDVAVRWTEGPGDLEGAALGDAAMVTVGEGEWIAWPGDAAPDGENSVMMTVGDAGQALSAAVAGIGRARVPLLLAQGWRELGRLDALATAEPGRRGYWLVAPVPQWRQKKVRALVGALTQD